MARDWLAPAVAIVAAVTMARTVALWFNRTDLYVDESQYWLWGQQLDFGYYSKPPLIGWVIRAFTEIAGSDAPFWVRLPGSLFHGVTALILGALAARLFDGRTAIWVAAGYVTLPFVALGSLLISTDTIMAPFYAAALLAWFRATESRRVAAAALAGLFIGLAFMAKYAAIYFLLGAMLAAIVAPAMRLTTRQAIVFLVAFALTVAPNLIWNLTHEFTTVEHTMDNVGWVRGGSAFAGLNFGSLAEFFFAQFAVFGPVLFGALLWGWLWRGAPYRTSLTAFSMPVLLIVCVQALLSRAYANWAVACYFAGLLIAVPLLLSRARWLLWLSLAVNAALCILLPLLTVLAPWPEQKGKPLLARYIGQAALSDEIVASAKDAGVRTIVASDRAILADLFYTGRDSGLAIRAPIPKGRPGNYYEQNFALSAGDANVLYIGEAAPVCDTGPLAPLAHLDTAKGTYAGRDIQTFLVPPGCLNALR